MMHFRKKSSVSNTSDHEGGNHPTEAKISDDDKARLKMRTASVADPILDAVQEAQPFEQAADTFHDNMNRQSYFSNEEGHVLCDVFGQTITQADISNPTRARDERPLDTIRSFEYAVSGDPIWAQQLETPTYGFRVRPDFPMFGSAVAYDANGMPQQMGASSNQMYGEQAVYQPQQHVETGEKEKKKKRGLFGRMKKK
ncbi:hypothetical protein SEUBUCD646_0M04330 [Saccharomyces eubayanus]|uniref:Uncharacterized protein n=2 Tax=Saccharomyces TaxID=4930 RepID=A0A6C1EET8_SACPS|nr:hypothetical protein DI49_4382 [Saccharomyces eubayanus]KOG97624.1 hypothetical protein DI49_4382 [Saccharomyces eubayanus]QID87431.1 hypothetical protein GRS66_010108 [Saccharomyces pastorianus]CAI1657039.1 hypothetical protein SEUBUCD650_0M04270 [Saccharomyces eubayanus]CAI1687190.1 hypothetical protein SEUBUCD646_0M04330 [Saccharomyces eubayanus]